MSLILKWLLGPATALTVWLSPASSLTPPQQQLLGILAWVVIWWVAQPVNLCITGIIGVALTVALGVTDTATAYSGFSHKVVFLLIGTFFLAEAMKRHSVDRWITHRLLSIAWIQSRPRMSLGMMMVVAAILSWWFSATATTAMLIPIAIGLFKNLGLRLPLAIAFSTAVGGIAFPLGANPNILCRALIEQQLQIRIGFMDWMIPGLIVSGTTLVFTFFVLFGRTRITLETQGLSRSRLAPPQLITLTLLAALTASWIAPSVFRAILGESTPLAQWWDKNMPESIAALLIGSLLFIVPWRKRGEQRWQPTLTWEEAAQVDWNVILMVGAGLSLGTIMFKTGLAAVLASSVSSVGGASPSFAVAAGLILLSTIVVSEFTSNTATGELMLPIAIAMAQTMGHDPVPIAIGVAFIASLGFVVPAATPPVAVALSYAHAKGDRHIAARYGAAIDTFAALVIALVVGLAAAGWFGRLGLPI